MSEVFVGCSKCGVPLPIAEEAARNMILLGAPLTAAHDVCPGTEVDPDTEQPVLRKFRAQVTLMELTGDRDEVDVHITAVDGDTEVLAGIGHTVESESFAQAVNGPLTVWLNETWPKLMEGAAFADLPAPTPATGG